MKLILRLFPGNFLWAVIYLLVCIATADLASAQCSATTAPTYSNSCEDEYFDSIVVSGTGVSTTVDVAGITSCTGTFRNDYATQGTTAPGGSTVTLSISRYTTDYAAFLSVYIDWNNDGIYETSELAGAAESLSTHTYDTTYTFTVPTSGADTGVHLHMRVMLSEDSTGAPCSGSYGQTYDFFFIIDTGCTIPVVSFSHPTHDTVSSCPGGIGITITASGAGLGGSFTWAPSTGLSASTGGTVIANPSTDEVYSVTAITTSSCYATSLDTVTVISTGYPADSISYAGSSEFCLGDTVLLIGTAGPGYTYQWLQSGVAIGRRRQDYQATMGGTYTLVINAYGCVDTSAAVVLTNYPSPLPVITSIGHTLHTESYFTHYQWFENGIAITGATADSLIATSDGSYNVSVRDTNGCSDTAILDFAFSNVGVANIVNSAAIAIFPNPANSLINIISPVAVNAIITGIEGKLIMEQNNARQMDISHLAPGMYFIELYDENGNKLSIQRIIKN